MAIFEWVHFAELSDCCIWVILSVIWAQGPATLRCFCGLAATTKDANLRACTLTAATDALLAISPAFMADFEKNLNDMSHSDAALCLLLNTPEYGSNAHPPGSF